MNAVKPYCYFQINSLSKYLDMSYWNVVFTDLAEENYNWPYSVKYTVENKQELEHANDNHSIENSS